ncbi:MAG: HIT domain-containing protein [Gammaproteobacteria bacterium]|nr:HIT domain-containing protein [Gammaproteobacteria bacterium]
MINFPLDERLKRDCYLMGQWQNNLLLLMDNALLPWFILVPDTQKTELYQLPHQQQMEILDKINQLSTILVQHFEAKKLNIATIGNIVSQLHIHIIARSPEDHCWPSVAWGNPERKPYSADQLSKLTSILQNTITDQYIAYPLEIKPCPNNQ